MDLRAHVLRKLKRHNMFGGKHTAIEHLYKAIPKNHIGSAKKSSKILIKQNVILEKYTYYGLHISLDPEKLDEIMRIIVD